MASFASKIKANEAFKSAAAAQNLKPGQVKTKQAFDRVKAYAAGQKAGASQSPTQPAGNQGPTQAAGGNRGNGGSGYAPTTVGGNYVGSGLGIIGDVLNKYGSNESIAGLGTGAIFDIGKTQANTGLAIAYNDAFLGSLGNYQSGQENLKTGNTMKLMAQEGAISRDLLGKQGEEQRAGIRETGSQERLNIGATGEQQRLGYQEQGRQERETLGQKTLEERKLRADARGAIRSQGARFYG